MEPVRQPRHHVALAIRKALGAGDGIRRSNQQVLLADQEAHTTILTDPVPIGQRVDLPGQLLVLADRAQQTQISQPCPHERTQGHLGNLADQAPRK